MPEQSYDPTARAREEEAQRFLATASDMLSSSLDYEATLASVARLVVPAVADYVIVDLAEEDGWLRRVGLAHADPTKEELMRELQRHYPPDPKRPGVSQIWRDGTPVLSTEIDDEELEAAAQDARHLEILRELAPKSSMILPLVARGRALGVMSFAMTTSGRSYDEADLAFAGELVRRVALAIDNARLYHEAQEAKAKAERAERRAEFLAEAGAVLAGSLDYETTLTSVAQLAVPTLADWCVVHMVAEDGSLQRLAVAHADPEKVEWARELQRRFPPNMAATRGIPNVLRTGRSEFYPEILDSMLVDSATDDEHLAMLRRVAFSSAMVVPLVARGHTLGTISFAVEAGRRYTKADLALAEALAPRAALAVDNARLYERASEANRLKDDFLATVSHELRTPLNSILGWARMLRLGTLDDRTTSRAVETIERNANAQARIINDILDVSRIITGKLRLEVRSVDLIKVIAAALDSARPVVEAKSLRLETAISVPTLPVPGDPDRLQQIVWNLLSNAIKFTPSDGTVEIRLEREDDHARIVVRDTGQGIRPEFLPHVFERFRQADSSITRSHSGLGLGLAIVRHLVELHGGSVRAESEGEGRGSTFTVELPIAGDRSRERRAIDDRLVEAERTAEAGSSLEGLRVLVVDDEPDAREMIEIVLSQRGASVRTAASAAEALEILGRWPPDVLVSDIGMPGEDGYSLIAKVRALGSERAASVPALALTAYARPEDREQALTAGYQMHITKPVEPADLAEAIGELAGRAGPTRLGPAVL